MNFRHDVTIIIQGKLNNVSINNLHHYRKFGRVIVSTWKDCSPRLKLLAWARGAKLVSSPDPRDLYNVQNIACQCVSTLAGLQAMRTEYAIKVRSDEYYTDLSKFIFAIKSNPSKLVTNNVFFRYDHEAKAHPSDHVVGGTRDHLLKTYELLLNKLKLYKNATIITAQAFNCEGRFGRFIKGVDSQPSLDLVAEQLMCLSFLESKKIQFKVDNSRNIMLNNFECVNVAEMGEFRVSCNSCKERYFTKPSEIIAYRSIYNLEDL